MIATDGGRPDELPPIEYKLVTADELPDTGAVCWLRNLRCDRPTGKINGCQGLLDMKLARMTVGIDSVPVK